MATTNNTDACNCIQSIAVSKTPTSVTATITFPHDAPDKIVIGGYVLERTNVHQSGYVKVTATYSWQFDDQILGFAHFKVMNSNIVNSLREIGELSWNKVVGTTGDLFVKLSDNEYLTDVGFTPNEIFDLFGIKVLNPPITNYKITELVVRNGMTPISLVSAIFPIPMVINVLPDATLEIVTDCQPIGVVAYEKTIPVTVIATGMQSRPVNIEYETDIETKESPDGKSSITYQKNAFGKIHSVLEETYTYENYINFNPDEILETGITI